MSAASLKEQIIALNLDLEDKIKVGELLERRIEKARHEFDRVESIARERYSGSLKDEKEKHKEIAEDLTKRTEELVAEKMQLMNELKERVNDIQQAEQDLQAEIRSLYREAERELDVERKRFKAGYEDRLQKYISQKAQEIKDSTSKALEPEFLRLEAMHEREVSECELNFQIEERRLQENLKSQLESSIEEEKSLAKEELKYSIQSIQDKYARELEFKIRDHRVKQRHIQEDYDKELDKLSNQYQEKLAKYRKKFHQEIQDLQQQHQQRITDLKKSHHLHMENIHGEHDEMMKSIRRKHLKEKKKLEYYVREKNENGEAVDISGLILLANSGDLASPTKSVNRSLSDAPSKSKGQANKYLMNDEEFEIKLADDTDTDSDVEVTIGNSKRYNQDINRIATTSRTSMEFKQKEREDNNGNDDSDPESDVRARPPISPSRMMTAPPSSNSVNLKSTRPSSSAGSKKPCTASSNINRSMSNDNESQNNAVKFTSPALQERYLTSRKETENKRDRQIQAEIRQLEAETIKLERELRAKVEHEKQSILSVTKAEEENLCNQAIHLSNEVTELVKERESLFQIQEEENHRHDRYKQEINDLKKQMQTYKDGIVSRRNELREQEELLRLRLRELQLEYSPMIRDIKKKCDEVSEMITKEQNHWKEENDLIKKEHATELAKLDSSVKSEVSKRDEEITELREIIDEDRSKLQKLQTMIEKYGKRNGAGDKDITSTLGEEELMVLRDATRSSSSAANRSRSNSKSYMGGKLGGTYYEQDNQTQYSAKTSATVSTASHSRYARPLSRTSHK